MYTVQTDHCEWREQMTLRHPPVTDEQQQRLLLRLMAQLALATHDAMVDADHRSENHVNARLSSLYLFTYICISVRPSTLARLVNETGYQPTTVKRYLKSLAEGGLIEKSGRGYIVSRGFLQCCCTSRRFNRFHHALVTACAMLNKYI